MEDEINKVLQAEKQTSQLCFFGPDSRGNYF